MIYYSNNTTSVIGTITDLPSVQSLYRKLLFGLQESCQTQFTILQILL